MKSSAANKGMASHIFARGPDGEFVEETREVYFGSGYIPIIFAQLAFI